MRVVRKAYSKICIYLNCFSHLPCKMNTFLAMSIVELLTSIISMSKAFCSNRAKHLVIASKLIWYLWGCRVSWQHLSRAAHWLSLTRQKLRTNDNFLQIPQWPLGRVPLINGGGEGQMHGNSDGVPNVPKRRNSTQCITDWIGEEDNPQTTVTCSPQSRTPSQHLEKSQATPFHSL